MLNAETIPASRDAHLEREGFWAHDLVTPARREDDGAKKLTDIAGIGFPFQILIAIVSIAVTAYGAVWAANSKQEAANAAMRTDIAVIRQVQTDQSKVDEYKSKLDDAERKLLQQSIETVKTEVGLLRGQINLANLEISSVRREINERGKR